ncbi:MAG: hypothetical protein E7774_00140 [Bradyrhizobium sp.]|nr:MAG: hypothetical protein E7774_00140 [Bradyrhizobium sp.]
MSESKIDDRLARLFPDHSEAPVVPVVAATPLETVEAVFAAPPVAIEPPVSSAPAAAPREPLLYADSTANADLLNAGEATWPLAELCLAIDAQSPFLIGFLGPSGSGASFALRRWRENVETLAAAAARTSGSPFVSNIVVATIDAASVADDPASAIASAAFAALERDRDGVNYAALADEAAHAGADPLRAATAAAERHDEAVRRLETERASRDEVEAKRARLTEALLYETPGSRVDGYIRAKRSAIDTRLRQFDLAEGDPALNYRHLVRDFDAAGPAARASVFLRAIWAYRGQFRWLTLAFVAFLLAFALGEARGSAGEGLRGLATFLAPFADWLAAHDAWLAGLEEGLTIVGFVALAINLWRAFAFAAMLLRGQSLLTQDLRDRRRELDLSSARLNQRVATLDAQVDAAARHAEAATKRVGAVRRSDRAPGPIFTSGPETPRQAANAFFIQLGRLMSASSPTTTPAPQRLVFVFDNLDALAPAAAAQLLETAHAMLGPGSVGAVACNPAFLARLEGEGDAVRRRIEKLFPIVFNVATLVPADSGRFVARLIGSNAVTRAHRHADAGGSAIVEPFSPGETALLAALAPLAGSSPRAVKRFLNAYRVSRASSAPRPVVALMLAVRLGGDRAALAAIREALAGHGPYLADLAGPPSLVAAIDAARGAGGAISLADAQSAWEVASRYTLPG